MSGISATFRIGTTPRCSAPRNCPGSLVNFLEKILQLPKDGAGVLLENQAGGSEQDSLSAPLEERDAQSRFQVAHLLGNAGLRNAEAVRGAAEAAGFRHCEKIAEMANFHGSCIAAES